MRITLFSPSLFSSPSANGFQNTHVLHCFVGLINRIKLMLIDEIHFLGDAHRGATLEAVVTRMKIVRTKQQHNAGRDPLRCVTFGVYVVFCAASCLWCDGVARGCLHANAVFCRPTG